jgi:hypothetical protein
MWKMFLCAQHLLVNHFLLSDSCYQAPNGDEDKRITFYHMFVDENFLSTLGVDPS